MQEIWLDIKGFGGLYQVSNMGRVRLAKDTRQFKSGKIMKSTLSAKGYPQIGLTRDGKQYNYPVHRLVATAFLGDCPQGYQCNHKNGVRDDARVDNLEWVTPSDNLKHAFRVLKRKTSNGVRIGSDHHNTKLDGDCIPTIRRLLANGVSMREIGRQFSVHWSTIRSIRDGVTWKDV